MAFLLTLLLSPMCWAESATYDVQGSTGGKDYRGRAVICAQQGKLSLVVKARGRTAKGPLARTARGWTHDVELPASAGLRGRLSSERAEPLRRRATYVLRRDDSGVLDGTWCLIRGRAVVQRGREVLIPRAGSGLLGPLRTSPLMAEVTAAVLKVASKGTVPRKLLLSYGNTVAEQVFKRKPEIFAEHARLIANARTEVLLQTYSWKKGDPQRRVLRALQQLERRQKARRAKEPVRVRIVVNEYRFSDDSKKLARALAKLKLDPRYVDVVSAASRHTVLGAMHTKALIVDGDVALVGSANVGAHHKGAPWLESMFRVEGQVVRGLRADFVDLWRRNGRGSLPALATRRRVEDPIPVLIASRKANGNPFSNDAKDPQGRAFTTAIRKARSLIRLQTPNLNDDAIKHAIVHAIVKNRCIVQLVLSRGFNETAESLPTQGGRNHYTVELLYRRLRRVGGADAERRLDVRYYAVDKKVVRGGGAHASHAKYASFDGHLAIVGSGNLDTQSLNHSREVNLVVDSFRIVQAWDRQLFEPSFVGGIPVRLGPTPTR